MDCKRFAVCDNCSLVVCASCWPETVDVCSKCDKCSCDNCCNVSTCNDCNLVFCHSCIEPTFCEFCYETYCDSFVGRHGLVPCSHCDRLRCAACLEQEAFSCCSSCGHCLCPGERMASGSVCSRRDCQVKETLSADVSEECQERKKAKTQS